jgi:hypothetical protein
VKLEKQARNHPAEKKIRRALRRRQSQEDDLPGQVLKFAEKPGKIPYLLRLSVIVC